MTHRELSSLTALIGCPAESPKGVPVLVFDWSSFTEAKKTEFVSWVFGDTHGPLGFEGLIQRLPKGRVAWASTTVVPFALWGVAPSLKTWRFRGGRHFPLCKQLLLADGSSGAVLGVSLNGRTVSSRKAKRVAPSLQALGLRPPTKKTVTINYAAVGKALVKLDSEIHTSWHYAKFHKVPEKAKAAKEKARRLLAALQHTIDQEPAFKAHPGISKLPGRYRAAVESASSGSALAEVTRRALLFFDRSMAVKSFDAWMRSENAW